MDLTYTPEDGNGLANRMWEMPTSYAELVDRRAALERWSSLHAGFLGRSPDHVASCITGMAMAPEVFGPERGRALTEYYRFARDNDLYLTYVIINPQANRGAGAAEQQTEDFVAGIVDKDAQGITVRGAKMLSTAGIMANEVLVTTIIGCSATRSPARIPAAGVKAARATCATGQTVATPVATPRIQAETSGDAPSRIGSESRNGKSGG